MEHIQINNLRKNKFTQSFAMTGFNTLVYIYCLNQL